MTTTDPPCYERSCCSMGAYMRGNQLRYATAHDGPLGLARALENARAMGLDTRHANWVAEAEARLEVLSRAARPPEHAAVQAEANEVALW